MNVQIEESWKQVLTPEFDKDYFIRLTEFVRREYQTTTVYPPGKLIFNAFNLCPYNKVKVVIIGQDPYHGPGQAHGLCFSVNDGIPFPPSLQNIFKEIHDDLGTPIPTTGNLTRWAEQGVLLLNATLTVRAHQAGSHQRQGWEEFYGCSNPSFSRKPGASGIYFMGSVCTKERGFYRPQQAFGSDICTPFAAFCLPRLFRKQTFQPRKRISDSAWRRTNQMVKLTYRYEKSRRIVFRGSFHIIAQQMYINTR